MHVCRPNAHQEWRHVVSEQMLANQVWPGVKIDLHLHFSGKGATKKQGEGDSMGENLQILDALEIDRILKRMACEILEVHKEPRNLALVGIHTRGVFLALRLASYIEKFEGIKIPTGEIDITLYRDDWTQLSSQPVVQKTEIPFSVDGKQIILVDDVLFTGRTVRAAMDAVMDFGRPARIELAVLIDRGHRELPIQSNYTGHSIRTVHQQMVNVLLRECDQQDCVVLESSDKDKTASKK
jgi:pyrimidine operon attenuation protein/uracil phosphoribosyltransferase